MVWTGRNHRLRFYHVCMQVGSPEMTRSWLGFPVGRLAALTTASTVKPFSVWTWRAQALKAKAQMTNSAVRCMLHANGTGHLLDGPGRPKNDHADLCHHGARTPQTAACNLLGVCEKAILTRDPKGVAWGAFMAFHGVVIPDILNRSSHRSWGQGRYPKGDSGQSPGSWISGHAPIVRLRSHFSVPSALHPGPLNPPSTRFLHGLEKSCMALFAHVYNRKREPARCRFPCHVKKLAMCKRLQLFPTCGSDHNRSSPAKAFDLQLLQVLPQRS